jgi:phosphoenolpyruvate synthase/pyruvate phosphate dikinase
MGLVTPDHIEVGKADGRTLRYRVATKKVISAFDYAAGRVVETNMPTRLVDRRVLDDEQIAAVVDAVLAVERYYGYPVDVEWVLDKYRRPGPSRAGLRRPGQTGDAHKRGDGPHADHVGPGRDSHEVRV